MNARPPLRYWPDIPWTGLSERRESRADAPAGYTPVRRLRTIRPWPQDTPPAHIPPKGQERSAGVLKIYRVITKCGGEPANRVRLQGLFIFPVIALKIRCFHSSYVVLEDHPQFSPERESRAQTMRHTVVAANIRRVDDDIAPCAFPSALPLLHTTRALDSRCDENDGVGLPDSYCGSNNGYQVTSSYLHLHGPERGHRNADNEKAPGPPRRFRRAPAVPERLLPGCVEVLIGYWNSSSPRCRRRAIWYVWPSAPGVGECAARNRASPIITCRPDSAPILDSNCLNAASTI